MHKKILLAVLVLTNVCTFPLTTRAVGNVSVSDTFAGIPTTVQAAGFSLDQMDIVLRSPSGAEVDVPAQADANGNATVVLPGDAVQEAGVYDVTVQQNGQAQPAEAHFAVKPGAVDAHNSSIESQSVQIDPNQTSGMEVRVTLRDAYANPLSGRPVNVIASRPGDTVTPLTTATDANGIQRFSVASRAPGQTTLSAIDVLTNTVIESRATLFVGSPTAMAAVGGDALAASLIPTAYAQSAPVASFQVQAPKVATVQEPIAFSVRAVDANGNLVPEYNGSIYISTDDPSATLPGINSDRPGYGQLKFLVQAQGQLDVPATLTFAQPGVHELRVEDASDPTINGKTKIVVGASGTSGLNGQIQIITPHDAANSLQVQVTGKAAPFSNLTIEGGTAPVNTQSDANGSFAAVVQLPAGTTQATFKVSDQQAVLAPASVTFTVDAVAPTLQAVTFSPPSPEAGGNVLAMTQVTDTDVKSIALVISGQTYMFAKNPSNPTLYQTLFIAPAKEDTYSVITTATDQAGNASTLETKLTVAPKGLAQVQNVQATGQINAVKLTWNAAPEKVEGYRIYFGQADASATNQTPIFDRSIDTKSTTPSAIVQGLNPGVKYLFAVTSLLGNRESTVKSDAVSATPDGIHLQLTPGDGKLTLQWSFPNAPTLGAYLVRFGVQPDDLSEQRMINAGLEQYDLTDLLPNITYYVQLVPVAVNGQQMTDIAPTAQGTPTGDGAFHPAPAETSPITPGSQPPISLHPGAPSLPSNGLPPFVWWTALTLTLLAYALHRRQRRERKRMRAFTRMMQQRYHQYHPVQTL